jgi:hypothetical protein
MEEGGAIFFLPVAGPSSASNFWVNPLNAYMQSRNSRNRIGKLSRLAIHPCIVGDQRRLRS